MEEWLNEERCKRLLHMEETLVILWKGLDVWEEVWKVYFTGTHNIILYLYLLLLLQTPAAAVALPHENQTENGKALFLMNPFCENGHLSYYAHFTHTAHVYSSPVFCQFQLTVIILQMSCCVGIHVAIHISSSCISLRR